jgi:hypothetical protein
MRPEPAIWIHAAIPRLILATLVLLAQPSGNALAEDLLGLYVGGAVGQSELRANIDSFSCAFVTSSCPTTVPSASFARHATGWEGFAGIRPLPFVGAEAEYIDFGSGGTTTVYNIPAPYSGITHPTATALFAVGYLPIPLPFLDIFGKAGVAALRSNVNISGVYGACGRGCDPVYLDNFQSSVKGTSARPAYGAGLQIRLGSFALRTTYERISVNTGDPDLLSLGVSWLF